MDREVVRKRNLPSFSMDLGDVKALCSKLHTMFDDGRLYESIRVDLQSEVLQFDTA